MLAFYLRPSKARATRAARPGLRICARLRGFGDGLHTGREERTVGALMYARTAHADRDPARRTRVVRLTGEAHAVVADGDGDHFATTFTGDHTPHVQSLAEPPYRAISRQFQRTICTGVPSGSRLA